jgi:hypothetical protein
MPLPSKDACQQRPRRRTTAGPPLQHHAIGKAVVGYRAVELRAQQRLDFIVVWVIHDV